MKKAHLASIEKVFDGIPMPGKGAMPASDMVGKYVSNPVDKAAVNRIAEATGEGVEEVAENLVKPYIQQYTYGKQVNHSKVFSSLGEAFAVGALASLLLGVTGDVKNGIEAKRKNSIPPTQVNTEVSQSAVSDTAFSNPSIADLRENATPLSKENTVRTPSESKPKSESKLEFVRNGIFTPSISNSAQNATPASKEVSDNILNQLYNQPVYLGAKTSQFKYKEADSKFRTNTMENMDMLDAADRTVMPAEEFKHQVITKKQSLSEAAQRAAIDFDGEVADLMKKRV